MENRSPKKEVDRAYIERPYWTEREAADFMRIHRNTLSKSRYNGVLLGRPAPDFTKHGRSVRYSKAVIEKWMSENPTN